MNGSKGCPKFNIYELYFHFPVVHYGIMHRLNYQNLGESSPLQIKKSKNSVIAGVPFLEGTLNLGRFKEALKRKSH